MSVVHEERGVQIIHRTAAKRRLCVREGAITATYEIDCAAKMRWEREVQTAEMRASLSWQSCRVAVVVAVAAAACKSTDQSAEMQRGERSAAAGTVQRLVGPSVERH